jgi:hypothetical protein
MQAQPSWFHEILIPAFFTFFGAVLGFFASQVRDAWNARRAKKSFLLAVGMELDALDAQLDASLREVSSSEERVKAGGTGASFAGVLRTSVFTGQIGKLRDVDDPTMIEIIHFYSDIGTLERILDIVKDLDAEHARTTSDVQKPVVRARLLSALRVLQEQLNGFRGRLTKLRAKLPAS